jgi:diguanylate cyclase (GGDEF)-like protein
MSAVLDININEEQRKLRRLDDSEFQLFAHGAVREQVAAGRTIFRRGEYGRVLFIIESGAVRLEFGDTVADKQLGPREYFGELALFVGQHARMASAVAIEPSSVLKLSHAAFELLLEQSPALVAGFMLRSFAYLVASEQHLISKLRRKNEDLQQTLDLLRRTQSELNNVERLTQTDELTSLNNRRGLYTFLSDSAQRRIPGTRLALMLIDVDHFKQINDVHGHLAGDLALRAIAQEIAAAAEVYDLACRLGGDEFGVLLQVRDQNELETRAQQIVLGVRHLLFQSPNENLRLSVSIGVSFCDEELRWPDWYGHTDNVLYKVKSDGGDGYALAAS